MSRTKGFSLIELMVVIAVVAVLAAAAVPAYQKYMLKARIAKAMQSMMDIVEYAKHRYSATGSFEHEIIFGGVNINNHATPQVNDPIIYDLSYYNPQFYTPSLPSPGVEVYGALTGLSGLPDYQEPSGFAYWSYHNRQNIAVAVKEVDGMLVVKCGMSQGSNADVPLEYMPSVCTCDNVTQWLLGNHSC